VTRAGSSSRRSAGEHSLIAIRSSVGRPTGRVDRFAGGCVFTQVVRPTKPQAVTRGFCLDGHSGWGIQINSERYMRKIQIIGVVTIYNVFSLICKLPNKICNRHHISLTRIVKRLVEMYISLAASRAKGFMKWSDPHQPERLGDARAGAGEGRIIAAPDLAQGVTTPPRTAASSVARARRGDALKQIPPNQKWHHA
jgi:hypothetical protein